MNRQNILLVASASIATALAMMALPAIGQLATQAAPVDVVAEAVQGPQEGQVQLAQLATVPAPERIVPASQVEVQQSFAPVVQATAPAVVNVYSSKLIRRSSCPYTDPFWANFYCPRNAPTTQERVENSLGSGVIVSDDGVIVTNNHVVEQGDEFRVVLSDRREFPATLVMGDSRTDLAVLKVDTRGAKLPKLGYADTRGVMVGDIVLAIGNPFGVGQTVTSGIISALARTDVGVSDYASFIQTDASINPGNSGGALVDMQGRLVGVNTLIFSRGGGSNGIGFAIPSEMVRRIVDAAVNGGTLVRPWLGAKGDVVTATIAQSLGLDRPRGVLIAEIFPGGPAERAGLRKGDVVLTVDGREVFDDRGMKFIAATKAEGEQVALNVLRSGREQTLNVRLASPPGAREAELKVIQGASPFSGLQVAELSPALAEELGRDPFQTGVVVNRVYRGSKAAYARFQPNDFIREVNGQAIRTMADLEQVIAKVEKGQAPRWNFAIERNGRRIEASVQG